MGLKPPPGKVTITGVVAIDSPEVVEKYRKLVDDAKGAAEKQAHALKQEILALHGQLHAARAGIEGARSAKEGELQAEIAKRDQELAGIRAQLKTMRAAKPESAQHVGVPQHEYDAHLAAVHAEKQVAVAGLERQLSAARQAIKSLQDEHAKVVQDRERLRIEATPPAAAHGGSDQVADEVKRLHMESARLRDELAAAVAEGNALRARAAVPEVQAAAPEARTVYVGAEPHQNAEAKSKAGVVLVSLASAVLGMVSGAYFAAKPADAPKAQPSAAPSAQVSPKAVKYAR